MEELEFNVVPNRTYYIVKYTTEKNSVTISTGFSYKNRELAIRTIIPFIKEAISNTSVVLDPYVEPKDIVITYGQTDDTPLRMQLWLVEDDNRWIEINVSGKVPSKIAVILEKYVLPKMVDKIT